MTTVVSTSNCHAYGEAATTCRSVGLGLCCGLPLPDAYSPVPKAGGGNRTRVASLEGWSSTIELHPRRGHRVAASLLAEPVGERLELVRVQPDLAGLERSLDLTCEGERLGGLIMVEHGAERGDHRVPLVQLDVDGVEAALVVDVRIVGHAHPDRHRAAAGQRRMLDHRC